MTARLSISPSTVHLGLHIARPDTVAISSWAAIADAATSTFEARPQEASGLQFAFRLDVEHARDGANHWAQMSRPADGECLVCLGRLGNSRLPGLRQCQRCGFVTANLDISDAELQALYGRDYFHGAEYADYVAEEPGLRRNFAARLQTLLAFIAPEERRRLFEIGCAYGFFLAEARPYFSTVAGIDISCEGTRHAREALKIDAVTGDYLEYPLAAGTDVICLWDTIEHLREPQRFVEQAARDLRSGGLLAITTGDIGSLNARLRGRRWRMIHPPTHLHYFSVPTLSQLLARHGFTVVHVEHPGVSRTLQSILYISLVVMQGRQKLYDLVKNIPGLATPVTLNLFDVMYVIAKKV